MTKTKPHILLVEDEEHLSFLLDYNLSQEGYHVDVAATLAEAKTRLSTQYQLLILDVMLPDGESFELCREIRRQGSRTPVLFLTAKGSSDDVVQGLESGGDDYMTKPFALRELFARVSAMLRRAQWQGANQEDDDSSERDDVYRFRGHSINFETHEAHVHGEPVELTDLEVRLLRYFIEHANRVVSRDDILEKVWKVSPQVHTRTVDNFLVRLRRLFEEDPSTPQHFVTIRGVGYRFIPDP